MIGRDIRVAERVLAFLILAGLALHEIRHNLVGPQYSHAGSHDADGLLTALALGFAVLLTFICVACLFIATCPRAPGLLRQMQIRNVWLVAGGALLAIYAGQELLQGAVHAHYSFGLHDAFGHGGWVVVPFAMLLGGIVAMAVGVVDELERHRALVLSELAPGDATSLIRPERLVLIPSLPLAEHLAGRSPPSLVI